MPKNLLFIMALIVISATAYFTVMMNADSSKISKAETETAVNQARLLYKQQKETGRDLSNGPCLSDALLPNWVLDIAHNPRQPIDDLPQNQCSGFREGRAQHFVELDSEGNLIRAQ